MSMSPLRNEGRNLLDHGLYTQSLQTMMWNALHSPDGKHEFMVYPHPGAEVKCYIEYTGDEWPIVGVVGSGRWMHFHRSLNEARFQFTLGRIIQRVYDLEERNGSNT